MGLDFYEAYHEVLKDVNQLLEAKNEDQKNQKVPPVFITKNYADLIQDLASVSGKYESIGDLITTILKGYTINTKASYITIPADADDTTMKIIFGAEAGQADFTLLIKNQDITNFAKNNLHNAVLYKRYRVNMRIDSSQINRFLNAVTLKAEEAAILQTAAQNYDPDIDFFKTYNLNTQLTSDITNKNPDLFLDKELSLRRSNNLPPYQRFVALIVTGNDENVLEKESIRFKNFIEKTLEGKILGPVNAPIFRLKKKFRIRLLVRGKKSLKVQSSLTKIISKFKFATGLKLIVDVDPINFN